MGTSDGMEVPCLFCLVIFRRHATLTQELMSGRPLNCGIGSWLINFLLIGRYSFVPRPHNPTMWTGLFLWRQWHCQHGRSPSRLLQWMVARCWTEFTVNGTIATMLTSGRLGREMESSSICIVCNAKCRVCANGMVILTLNRMDWICLNRLHSISILKLKKRFEGQEWIHVIAQKCAIHGVVTPKKKQTTRMYDLRCSGHGKSDLSAEKNGRNTNHCFWSIKKDAGVRFAAQSTFRCCNRWNKIVAGWISSKECHYSIKDIH